MTTIATTDTSHAPVGSAVHEACYLAGRDVRALLRQPWYVAITLVQPIIWLLLFRQMFSTLADVPGFGAPSYVDYITPGVVVMTALYSNGWAGMSYILDMEGGILDRFLVAPVHRGSMITGRLLHAAVLTLTQSLIILGLAAATGARFQGGVLAVLAFLVAAILLGWAFASASCALALVLRRQEVVIAVVNLFVLPLSFLSSAFLPTAMLPGWIQAVAKVNPVNWAVEVGRQAVTPGGPGSTVDWTLVATRLGLLAVLAAVAAALSTRAFRSYQRSA